MDSGRHTELLNWANSPDEVAAIREDWSKFVTQTELF